MPSPRRRPRRGDPLFTVGRSRKSDLSRSMPEPQPPGATLFICKDDYNIAAFCFERRDGVLRPVDEIAPFSPVKNSLNRKVARIACTRTIDVLIVPPNVEKNAQTNQLYTILPPGYKSQIASGKPGFVQCCEARAIALNDGRLVEKDYSNASRLIQELQLCAEGEIPSLQQWAYLLGLHELLTTPDWSQLDPKKFFFSASPPFLG